MALAHEDKRELIESLLDAFPRTEDLEVMLALELNSNIETITTAGNLKTRVLHVVNHFSARGGADGLIAAAQAYLGPPGNHRLDQLAVKLQTVAKESSLASRKYGQLVADLPPRDRRLALERVLPGAPNFVDPAVYMDRLERACAAVARVEQGGKQVGTSFLVGHDVVLTNQHVKAELTSLNEVRFVFDYAADSGGRAVSAGTSHALAREDWCIAERPPSANDPGGPVLADELDYALLRLATPAAADSVGTGRRGFIDWTEHRKAEVRASEALLIVQYPQSTPLSLAYGPADTYDADCRRLRYLVNTLPGSSGSPVFDVSLELVALHHSSDGRFVGAGTNQGIPIALIVADLRARGLSSPFGCGE